MTDEILSMMDDRRPFKNKDRTKYQKINRQIRKEIRKAKEQWLLDRCAEMEEFEEKHDHFNIHKLVKEITGHRKPCSFNSIVGQQINYPTIYLNIGETIHSNCIQITL